MPTAIAMSPELPSALATALDDEYRARASYQAILQRFGPVTPFINIAAAEQRHIDALLPLFVRYGITPPVDRWAGQVAAPATLQQACASGVAGEIGNYRMYDDLLTRVVEPDVRAVFMSLRNASAYRHLPAFQSCAGVATGTPVTASADQPMLAPRSSSPSSSIPLWLGVALGLGAAWWLVSRREA